MSGTAPTETPVLPFRSPGRFLSDLDAATTARIIAAATDVALVLRKGVIKDIALASDDLATEGYERAWRDKPWIETVTVESRPKIEELLRGDRAAARWRQVNHPSKAGADLPIQYTAVKAGADDRVVALGRDLRSVARLQQRLVEVHQSLERDYARLRDAESRYELLFRTVPQALLIVDPSTLAIDEANPAAARALDRDAKALVGAALPSLFPPRSQGTVTALVAEAAATGSASASAIGAGGDRTLQLSASAFRASDATRVILRIGAKDAHEAEASGTDGDSLLHLLEELPDGLVVTSPDLRVAAANRAFLAMTQVTGRGQLVGARLADFLGRSPTDLNVLVSSLKSHGSVRNFATVLRDRFGAEEEVEISAVATPARDGAAYGFSVRNVARTLRTASRRRKTPPSSVDRLTGLVGRVPLREIVRESSDFIEKLCIEAALEITEDNRASAAEMLGLSRQGFYTKLRRFGLDDAR
jgi:transcriptional regulator PpsR